MKFDDKDIIFMRRCLQLAENGRMTCSPNPMVGAVIVKDGVIIGEGWHRKAGLPHAEPTAVASVKDKSGIKGATMYVSLEPCSHYGRTPPCADMIIREKFARVVIGSRDPFPSVAGRGIKKLIDAGIDVVVGVEEDACKKLNEAFFLFHTKKRPFIALKWAQTSDGFVDDEKNVPLQISSPFTRCLSHGLRCWADVVLVGRNTALKDNPSLTARYWNGNNPVRAVLDRKGVLPHDLNIFNGEVKTIVFTEADMENLFNVEYVKIDFSKNVLLNILNELYKRGFQRLLVEGGTKLLQSFIDASLWDILRVETSCEKIRKGVSSPAFELKSNFSMPYIRNYYDGTICTYKHGNYT